MNKTLYKEYFECNSDKEQHEKWVELSKKGYHGTEICIFNFEGKDGKFHGTIYVMNK